jgi:phosphatidylglycerophosphate synthase
MHNAHKSTRRMLAYLPNAISLARLLAAPILLSLVITGNREFFKWLLLACLLSDILDGLLARMFKLQTRLGAFLDSVADAVTWAVAAVALFAFEPGFIHEHYAPLIAIIALYFLEMAVALWRYKRISSFHTILVRVAAYLQGIFVMSLFLWGFHAWLFFLLIAFSTLGYLEELVLIALLPEWQCDVHGLYWVLARKKAR